MNDYYKKYIKYKIKYFNLKNQYDNINFNNKRILPENELKFQINNIIKNGEYGVWSKLPSELYVIGDIHGDFYALKQALELTNCVIFNNKPSNLINTENIYDINDGCLIYNDVQWNKDKNDCFIVFAGDLIDRCRYNLILNKDCSNTVNDENCDFKILELLLYLDEQAKKYNSRVITIIGNHEIMNLTDNYNYVSIKGKIDINRKKNIKSLIYDNINNIYGIIRINRYVITHGGVNDLYFEILNNKYDKYLINYESIEIFNALFRHNMNLPFNLDYKSPFWDRTIGGIEPLNKNQCKKIFDDNLLKIKGFTNESHLKLIVAHCVQFPYNKTINLNNCQDYFNRIYRIDVGMSRAFDEYIGLNNGFSDNYSLLKEYINKIMQLNYEDFYNIHGNFNEFRKVSILKITFNLEEKIIGETSIKYFYNTQFNNDKDRKLYLLSDIYRIFLNKNNKYQEIIDLLKQKIQEIQNL
jgi:hypothetical protein